MTKKTIFIRCNGRNFLG